jgi:hypothetical protein
VENGSALRQCEHGIAWEACESANCQEIWRLYQRAIQEESRERADWVATQRARASRGKKKSQYDLALEESRIADGEDHDIKASEDDEQEPEIHSGAKLLRNIFPDEITLQAAVQFRAVTLRQAELLEAYFDSDEGLANYKRWDAIGRKIGCSGKTVEREFRNLVGKFLKSKKSEGGDGHSTAIEVAHIRGERQPHYWRRHCVRFGQWKREWSELITDRDVIRQLRQQAVPMIRSEKTPVRSSPINGLFGALIRQFGSDLPKNDIRLPKEVSADDWEFNLRRARRILERKHAEPWTTLEVYYALGRGARVCGACRTFLIRGFRINGRRITRARQFCDEACKMKAERRKKNSTR